ncbi:MAG: undecaprenyl/decaprenyl-phosphate alpha-N-acetylglucosaminyl 1-phosphate transferase [Acidobacteria bacterium]|nr:undecaprenyl/decaprenyl-phosphate alpha-N-acetylglucosaminyl 1-phosphate transferase [Acidobacteriota bacterium]
MAYIFSFAIALAVAMLMIPPIKKLAMSWGVVDVPNERKVHLVQTPRMGGLAIVLAFMVVWVLFLRQESRFLGIVAGMLIVALVGFLDDAFHLSARWKFLGQFLAAGVAIYFADLRIDFLGGVIGSQYELGFLSVPLTLIWIVGITNAINLSDGLDGLAGGISFIALASFGMLAYQRGDLPLVLICMALLGATLGFLRYNTHPADIFMGDTGSLFLGFSLGTLSLVGNFKSLTTLTLITPILVLLIPIADTTWAIIRRLWEGRSPFSADKKHLHHRLLALGMDHTQSVSVIYALSAALSVTAVLLAESSHFKFVLIPLLVLFLAMVALQIFGALNFFRWAEHWSERLDGWVSSHLQSHIAYWSMRVILIPVLFYFILFAIALPSASLQIFGASAFVLILIGIQFVSKSPNSEGFLVFSLFFLASLVLFNAQMVVTQAAWLAPIERIFFYLLLVSILAHVVFQKKRDLILTTPLEIMILVLLVGVTFMPLEWRDSMQISFLLFRSIVLFMALKILLLATEKLKRPVVSALASSLMILAVSLLR